MLLVRSCTPVHASNAPCSRCASRRLQLSARTYSRIFGKTKAEREQKEAEEMKQYEAGPHPASFVIGFVVPLSPRGNNSSRLHPEDRQGLKDPSKYVMPPRKRMRELLGTGHSAQAIYSVPYHVILLWCRPPSGKEGSVEGSAAGLNCISRRP